MADGSITYKTELDNSGLERELARTNKKIGRLEGQALRGAEKRLPLAKQAEELGGQLDEAKAKLAALQAESQRVAAALSSAKANDPASVAAYADAAARQTAVTGELAAQQKLVDGLQSRWDRAEDRLDAMDAATKRMGTELEEAKARAGELAAELYRPATAADVMGEAVRRADDQMKRFVRRVQGLAKRVFVFTLITAALRAVKTWLGKMVSADGEAARAVARLRGALLTLAQPILSVLVPALTALVRLLTRAVTAAAGFVSLLFGKTIGQSKNAAKALDQEAQAIGAAGDAAEDAAKSLAGFDEINQLSGGASSGGGGAAASAPDFSFDNAGMEADFGKLLGWVKLIGAALLAWKLSDSFLGGVKTFVGLILAINGAIELAKGAWDAWQNGVGMDNFLEMLGGAALLAGGLAIAFGKVGAGIGLVAAGLTMFATGLHDALKNGWTFENLLTTISGLLLGGLGIALLTGSWLPLLVAGIAGVVLAFTNAFGQGQAMLEAIRTLLQGFLDFFKGVFTGNITLALQGVGGIVQGLRGIVESVILAVRTAVNSFLDWLDEKTRGKLHGLIEWVRGFLNGHINALLNTLNGLADSIGKVFSGLVEFIAGVFTNDWDMAWQGVKDVFRGIWNTIVTILETGINFIINGINFFIDGCNRAFGIIRALTGYPPEIPSIRAVELPRLAAGAVIPPNREFLAVLGDQTSGTNIETPLATMVQAFRQALREGGYGGGDTTVILEVDGQQFAKAVYKANRSESRRIGVSLAGV